MTTSATSGERGTLSAVTLWAGATFGGWFVLPGQGLAFVAASTAFVVDIVVSIAVSMVTQPKTSAELKGLVYSETPKEDLIDPDEAVLPFYQRTVPLALIALGMVVVLNFLF